MPVKGACQQCGSTIKEGDKSGRCGRCGSLWRKRALPSRGGHHSASC